MSIVIKIFPLNPDNCSEVEPKITLLTIYKMKMSFLPENG